MKEHEWKAECRDRDSRTNATNLQALLVIAGIIVTVAYLIG